MKLSNYNRIAINLVILSISIFVWVLLLVNPGHIMTIEHCCSSNSCPSLVSLKMLLKINPFFNLFLGWGLMVIAMMFPKLILPIRQIYERSFKRRRFLYAVLFVFGYITVWMLIGVFMIITRLGLHLQMPNSYIPAIGLIIIALIWEFSPIKQQFLNLGHDHIIIPAFGWAGYSNSLLYGIKHGAWCVGSGWALMLFPMLLPKGHNLAMLIVTFIMISEHLEHPRFPKWNIKFRFKLLKFIVAQTKMKLGTFL
jgi:predicted metal-binding membrane protein